MSTNKVVSVKEMLAEERQRAETARAKEVYFCSDCGCIDIECTAWINMNTDEITNSGTEGPTEDLWCPSCNEHFRRCEVGTLEEAEAVQAVSPVFKAYASSK